MGMFLKAMSIRRQNKGVINQIIKETPINKDIFKESPKSSEKHSKDADDNDEHLDGEAISELKPLKEFKKSKVEKNDDMIMLGIRAPSYKYVRKPFIIYPDDNFKVLFWDITISIVLLVTCFVTPINLAFADEVEKVQWYVIFTYCLDFVFLIDIFVNFFSAYQNDVFKMIDDRKVIAVNYIKGWFLIDLIAILPFDLIM